MNIIIFGPPLAGKGTQSNRIIKDYQLTHLSTGDVLRAEKEKETELGIQASTYSRKGQLVPDALVAKIVERFYHNHKNKKGILFDGYPRNIKQTKHLLNLLEHDHSLIDMVIFLQVPKEELLKRAVVRAKLENRKDDKDSMIVVSRINEFENHTIPAIDYIQEKGIHTVTIEGTKTIDEIYQIIKNQLD